MCLHDRQDLTPFEVDHFVDDLEEHQLEDPRGYSRHQPPQINSFGGLRAVFLPTTYGSTSVALPFPALPRPALPPSPGPRSAVAVCFSRALQKVCSGMGHARVSREGCLQ